jgi:Protein of unknown function (DUF1579)
MNVRKLSAFACIAAAGMFTVAGCANNEGLGDSKSSGQAAKQQEMKLPPGWTQEDMQACMIAGTPGEQHKRLAKEVGTWHGKTTMWMAPNTEPMTSTCTTTVKPAMDGRFTKAETKGEMPGMGPYHGLGYYGYDNVAQKFVSSWIDNHGTGIMNGTGELSSDGNTMTWTYNYTCPLRKQPTVMREVETWTGPNSKTLEMFGADPKSGQEYKMMSIELTRK